MSIPYGTSRRNCLAFRKVPVIYTGTKKPRTHISPSRPNEPNVQYNVTYFYLLLFTIKRVGSLPEGYSSLTGNGSAPGGRVQGGSAGLQAGLRIRIRIPIGSGFNRVSGSGSVFVNPDPNPGGQKLPVKVEII